jgi:hypothetical protein
MAQSNAYGERNAALLSMGFADYGEYLSSELWKGIRAAVYEAKGNVCCVCKRRAEVIHHCSYSLATLMGTDLSEMFPLCNGCHIPSPTSRLSAGYAEKGRLPRISRHGRGPCTSDELRHACTGSL